MWNKEKRTIFEDKREGGKLEKEKRRESPPKEKGFLKFAHEARADTIL